VNLSVLPLIIFVISPDDYQNCQPKHVAYMRNKGMSEYLYCCTGLIITENTDYKIKYWGSDSLFLTSR